MDEVDKKILHILTENARTTYTDIAKETGLSEGAVRKRVRNLIKSGIIRRFTIETSLTEEVKAIILVSTTTSIPLPNITDKVRNIDGVKAVYEVSGQYDIAAFLCGPDITAINKCVDEIRHIEGILNTNTLVVLRNPH